MNTEPAWMFHVKQKPYRAKNDALLYLGAYLVAKPDTPKI